MTVEDDHLKESFVVQRNWTVTAPMRKLHLIPHGFVLPADTAAGFEQRLELVKFSSMEVSHGLAASAVAFENTCFHRMVAKVC